MKSSHRPSRVSPGVALAFLGLVLVSLSTASAVTMQITALLAQGVNTDAVTYGSALTLPFTKGYGGVSFQPTVSTVTTTNVIDVYSTISTEVSAAAIVGPTSTDLLITIEQDGYAGVAQFAPFVESINWYTTEYATSFEAYYRFSYLTNPPASIQALAGILAIFKGNLLPKTIGAFTASQNLGFGSKAQEILSQVVPLVTGKALVSYSPATFQQNDFTTFIGNNMGGVLIFADRTDTKTVGSGTVATSTSFLQAYASSAAIKSQNTTTMLPFENQFMALSTFTGTGLDVRAVISTAPVPGVAATSYAAVQQFNSVKPGGMTNTLANFAMAGWVGGQVLMQSVFQSGMSTGYTDITTMQAVMLNSYTSYSVYDMYLGMYSPQCAATGTQSAYCSCHQLGNNVYMHRMNSNQGVVDFYPDPANDLLQVSVCPTINGANYFNAGTVTMPIHSVSLGMQDVANSPLICSNYFNAVLAISNPTLFAHASSHPYRSYCLTTNSGSAAADLTNLATNNIFSLLVGMIPDAFMQSTTYTVLDPLPVTTQLPSNLPNLIHLFSTVQQEVYQLTAYLSNIGVNSVCALVQESPSSTVLLEEIYRGLYAYGLVDAATGFNGAVKANQNLIPNIPGGCEAVFLIGITATDAAQLGSYLNSHSNMRVLLPFDDVTKYYTNILSTVSGGAASRLIFATNVPSWVNANNGGASSGFSTVSQFLSTIPANLQTPATVRSYIAAMVIDQLTVNDAPLTVPTIAYQVYNRVYFSAAGVNFGPYNSVCTLENNMVGASCLHNYGARDLSVWTFDNVLQKSQPVNYGIPSLYYKMTVVVVSSSSSSSSSSKPTCVWLDGESKSGSASLPPMPDNAKKTLTALLVIIALLVCAAIVALIVLILYRRGFFKYNPRKAHLRMIRSMEESQEEKAAAYTATHNLFSAPGLNSEQLAGVGGAGMGGGARDPVAALLTGGGDGGFGGGYGSELGHSASYGGSALGGTVMATFVVVDIESSTPLWAAVPEVMAQATICYQKVVRDAVAAHHGYEAQLVGDVFLIACEQAMNAVEIGRDIQVQLPKKMPANVANAIREAYEVVGRPQGSPGLRLRIGIHTGYASVSLDRQTQQCTYTGETRDTAVRTASLCPSGQVFLTERTTGAMSPPDLATLSLVSVGFHSLGASGAAEQRMLEVFELEFPNSVSSAGNVSAPMDAVHALYMLQTSDEWAYVSVIEVANQVIEAHLRDYTTDSAILTMSRCGHNFGLNIPPADRFRSKEEYVESLRDASSQRVASIMECINGARDAGGELEGANATVTTVVTRGPTVVAGNFSRVNRLRQRAPQPQGFTGTMRSNRWSANSSFVGNNSGRDRISTPEKPNPPMRSMNWNEGAEGEDSQRHRSYNNNANSPNGTFLREARNPQQHFDVTNGSSEAPPTRSGQRGATSPDTNRNPLSVQNSNVASHRNNGNYGADADDLSNSPRGLQRQLSRRNGN